MKPVDFEIKNGEYSVIHECVTCKHKKKNRLEKDDGIETLLNIAKNKT